MKKLMFLGLILTLFSVAVSAQQASDESYRHHRTEEGYRKGESGRPEMRRMEARRDFHEGRRNRFEHRRHHRMHRYERRHFRHNRHHRIY